MTARLILIALIVLMGTASVSGDTIGNTDTTNGLLYQYFANIVILYPIPAGDIAADFHADTAWAYCEGSSTSRKVKIVLYADNAGSPGDTIGTSPEITTTSGASRTWYKVPVDWDLTADTPYWIGAIADGAANLSKTIAGADHGIHADSSGSYAAIPADGSNAVEYLDEDSLKAACLYLSGGAGSPEPSTIKKRRKNIIIGGIDHATHHELFAVAGVALARGREW